MLKKLKKFYLKVCLYFHSPRIGDIHFGNPKDFVIGRPIEYVLHGLKDRTGATMWHPIPTFGCFRLTIEKETPEKDGYVCRSEVLCDTERGLHLIDWHRRSQPKLINKSMFKGFILNSTLKKSN